jgi:sugar phosphate isomerase/epimerase
MHPLRGRNHPPPSRVGLERFNRIVCKAEQAGVNVAIENIFDREKINCAAWLLTEISSSHFGLCFDAGHYNLFACDFLARFGHRLMSLHLHDNDTSGDQHRLPFDGTADWPALMHAIAATGYAGPTTLEVDADPQWYGDTGPEEFLALAYERAKQLEALLHA